MCSMILRLSKSSKALKLRLVQIHQRYLHLDHFGELQRAVIDVVWELGEATVRQVWKPLVLLLPKSRLAWQNALLPAEWKV